MVGPRPLETRRRTAVDGQAEAVRTRVGSPRRAGTPLWSGTRWADFVAIALAETGSGARGARSGLRYARCRRSGSRGKPALAGLACTPLIGPAVDLTALCGSPSPRAHCRRVSPPTIRCRRSRTARWSSSPTPGVCDVRRPRTMSRAAADRLAGLGKPVLVVWGERDVLTPTADQRRALPRGGADSDGHSRGRAQPDGRSSRRIRQRHHGIHPVSPAPISPANRRKTARFRPNIGRFAFPY